jgi:hypothetical protein
LQCLGDNPKDLDEWEIYRKFTIIYFIAPPPQASTFKPLDPTASIPALFETFDFSRCRIDQEHEYVYKLNPDGIYEVYKDDTEKGAKPISTAVFSLKKYYQDQEFILNICSEG